MENKYLQYTAEELALDSDFIDFVQGKSAHQLNWIHWIQNNPDIQSRIDEARHLVTSISFVEPKLSDQIKDRIWTKIDVETNSTRSETNNSKRNVFTLYRIVAAASVLLLFGYFLLKPNVSEYQNLDSVAMNIELPDQSDVALSGHSKLSLKKRNFTEERSLKLEGEAYFEVEKGASFTVETDHGSVEVLGTGFNVLATQNSFEVSCDHGKVKVNSPGFTSVVLTRGQFAYLDEQKGLVKTDVTVNKKVFYFKDKALRDVMDQIEDHYNINIKLEEDLDLVPLSGTFLKSQIDSTLQAICWPLLLEFTKSSDGTFQITR
jgi:ferric-dicitrate binding protein FerR (iron transport regulator)